MLADARIWTSHWRRQLSWYWRTDAKEHLSFGAMIGVPVLLVAGLITFAWLHNEHTDPDEGIAAARAEAAQRVVVRAQRREGDLECLAENVYFEARGEPLKGQYAVAEVTLNRTRAPNFPHTVCGVVHEMRWDPTHKRVIADFSWTEQGALQPQNGPAWKRAMDVASAEYDDMPDPIVPGALYYHATRVKPAWAKNRKAVATIGNHIFYQ